MPPDQTRRMYNQAFFTRVYVEQEYLRVELAEPFRTLCGGAAATLPTEQSEAAKGQTAPHASQSANSPAGGQARDPEAAEATVGDTRPDTVMVDPADQQVTPDGVELMGIIRQAAGRPPGDRSGLGGLAQVKGVEGEKPTLYSVGLKETSLVLLRETLSNLPAPLERLIRELGPELGGDDDSDDQPLPAPHPDKPPYRPNRMLELEDVAELVKQYRSGASERELAKRFGLHRQTVSAHLRREDVSKRSSRKMTPELVERATKLYCEERWSTVRIGKEFGLGASTVGKALKRAGVEMREGVARRW